MRHATRIPRPLVATVAVAALVAGACSGTDDGASGPATTATPATGGTAAAAGTDLTPVRFTDVTAEAGIDHLQMTHVLPPDCIFSSPGDGENQGDGGIAGLSAFADCQEERMAGGAAVGDVDGDGDPDLYLTAIGGPDALYRNDGDGTFTDITEEAGLGVMAEVDSNGAGFFDADGDGDQDLYVTTIGEDRFYFFANQGDGTFVEEAEARGLALADDRPRSGFSVAFGDYDGDGDVDVHTTEWLHRPRISGDPPEHARLLRNDGGTFTDVTAEAGVELGSPDSVQDLLGVTAEVGHINASFGSTFVDLDDDGLLDLAVSSDFGTSQVFFNEGDGTFADATPDASINSVNNAMGSTFADVDADGDLDWFLTAIYGTSMGCSGRPCNEDYTGNRLYRNEGDRTFSEMTDEAGVVDGFWGWGAAFADFDQDGREDLVMTNGQDFGVASGSAEEEYFIETPMRFWWNEGDGSFEELSQAVGLDDTGNGKGLLTWDYDADGDLDILVANNGQKAQLFRNDGDEDLGSWLQVDAAGTTSNAEGLNTVVTVTETEGGPVQRRDIGVSTHFLGQSERVAHFGLGDGDEPLAKVEAFFPATGRTVTLTDVERDQVLEITEPES